jgi:hypothetical protein
MGQFKPMVKMFTDEPSVILKLKKGGKVKAVAQDDGFKSMASNNSKVFEDAENGVAPKKPSMSERRKAMNPNFMKKGGKAEKHEDAAQDRAMIKKALAGKKFASGGSIDKAETKTTIEGNAKKFLNTKMDNSQKDKAHGTGAIKEKNAGGYKNGGTIEGNAGKFLKTKVVEAKKDTAHGTKGIKESNAGGFKKGGTVWENRPADGTPPGVTGMTTGGVRESNAGGFKKGGSTKKAYATGGNVVDDGKAEKMPRHFVSRPVANSLQSGTFKKGGKVGKYAEGSSVDAKAISDKASRELEEALNPISMAKELYGKAKSYLTSPSSAPGAVTKTKESVTVAPNKKRGGKVC